MCACLCARKPFSEPLVVAHTARYENPLKFSGKELDDITGLYDHGARSRNPVSTLWYGVDPLFEKYPDFSPYNYCAGNPVKLVDPTGCAGENTGGTPAKQQKDGTYTTAQSSTYVRPVFPYPTSSYSPERNSKGHVVIDHTNDAVVHYYKGKGESVDLGPKTQVAIRSSKDMNYYRERIENAKTSSPAEGSGLPVNMEFESWRTYHVGHTRMSYQTTCNSETCTTKYTISGDGFWDIITGDDKKGPDGELFGGDPYSYYSFTWSETYENPGYKFDSNGRPYPIKEKIENSEGAPSSN